MIDKMPNDNAIEPEYRHCGEDAYKREPDGERAEALRPEVTAQRDRDDGE